MFADLGSFTRLLIGVVLVQAITALVVVVALQGDWAVTWPLFGALALAVGVMAAFWFNAIVGDHRRLEAARQGARFAKEADALRRRAEQQATRRTREAEARVKAEAVRARRASWRSGLGLGGAAALGVMLLLGQMVAVGALVLGATGAGALWWRLRSRRREAGALPGESAKPAIEGERLA